MATSMIPNPNKVTSIPLTINTDAASGSGTITVCGRVASLTATITPNITGLELSLAWIPGTTSGMYAWAVPLNTTWLSCDYYHNTETAGQAEAEFTTGGLLRVWTPVKDKGFKISGTWITKGEG